MEVLETKAQLHYRYINFIFLGGFSLLGILGYLLGNYAPGNQLEKLAAFMIVVMALLLCMAILVDKLTKRIVLGFDKDFLVQIFNLKTGALEEEHQFQYNDIKSCLVSSGSARTCTFKLIFFDGSHFKLVFYSETAQFTSIENTDGFKVFKKLSAINPKIDRR